MNFIKQQVDAGIKPQKNHFSDQEFLDRKFAVMIEGSWLPVPFLQRHPEKNFEDKLVLSQHCQFHIKITNFNIDGRLGVKHS